MNIESSSQLFPVANLLLAGWAYHGFQSLLQNFRLISCSPQLLRCFELVSSASCRLVDFGTSVVVFSSSFMIAISTSYRISALSFCCGLLQCIRRSHRVFAQPTFFIFSFCCCSAVFCWKCGDYSWLRFQLQLFIGCPIQGFSNTSSPLLCRYKLWIVCSPDLLCYFPCGTCINLQTSTGQEKVRNQLHIVYKSWKWRKPQSSARNMLAALPDRSDDLSRVH